MKFNEVAPNHIAFIMDGNGRWAQKRLLPRSVGHREGVKVMSKIGNACFDRGVKVVTFYAFSTENRFRPSDEVDALFNLMRSYFPQLKKQLTDINAQFRYIGDITFFPSDLQETILNVQRETSVGESGVMNIALNYGGRDEIVRATNSLIKSGQQITEQSLALALDTAGTPDPDMLIRTGGEKRLSNFLLYQSAYTELFFTDTLWPAFNESELDKLLLEFRSRDRRFGKVK